MNGKDEDYKVYKRSESDATDDAVFETFLVMDNGRVFMLDEHLERMKGSVADLDLGALPDTDKLGKDIRDLAKKQENRNRVLRVQYSPSKPVENRCVYETRDPASYDLNIGLKIIVSDVKRNPESYLVYHKTNNYLENRIALKKATKKGYDDALFLNTSGDIAETTKANIFIVKGGKIYTPAIDSGILPGIVRAWVIQYATKINIPALQLFLDPEEISDAQEVFVTNSVLGVCRVGHIDWNDRTLYSSPKDTPITQILSEAYIAEGHVIEE